MARASGLMVMNGSKDGVYFMSIEFSDERMPIPLRNEGYYLGQRTHTAMIEEMSKLSGLDMTGVSIEASSGVEISVEVRATDEFRSVESQSSNGNSSRTAMDFVEEAPERLQSVADLPLQAGGFLPVRSAGRAPDLRRLDSSDEGDEVEITEVDEYVIFTGDQSNPVSLSVLPLEFEGQELIASGGSASTSEVSLCGKSGGLDVMRSITAWKLTFPENEYFCILVNISQMNGAKRWVKLEKPRSGYKETAEDVFCVAKFLAILKKEPHASEERVRNYLLEGDALSVSFCDHLRKQRSLMELYIDLDPVLKEADARKILLSLTQEKVTYGGKRVLLLDESSDEDNYQRVKKPKTDHPKLEDVSMHEYESEEEFYDDQGMSDEDDESDDEPGDSLCIFCDDGGYLLCCDGPCMRSFHPRRKDGIATQCKTLGFPDETDIESFKRGWFCTNCKTKKHQCYVCGELGDSDEALGSRRQVFVCDVASCGKFYHPRCVASKLKPPGGEREELAKGIRAGVESFTCPLHRCKKCGKGQEKKDKDLNLATCRRCPAAWHVKCLPRNISFEGEDEESNFEVRAWELGKRFIIYCTDHKILRDLGTPIRNHIKFREKIPEATTSFKKSQKKVNTAGSERPSFRAKASSSAASQILSRSADTARPATQKPSEDPAKRLIADIVDKSRKTITEESVTAKLFLPTIYQRKDFNWMMQGRFDSILNGARAAMEKFRQTGNWEDARLKCAQEQVNSINFEEDRLRTFLAPTLHGKRYTSYGRHFTKVDKLQKVVEALQPYIQDGDTIVDFSCGDNSFSRLLHDALSTSDKSNCEFKSFDIFTPKDTLGFERKDWLSVGVGECGPGDKLVIGLNPPFAHTDRFISHALSMNPRVLVLIVPPLRKNVANYGYQCLLDDPTTMAEKSFFLPGSVHGSNDECLEQGNSVAPHLYVFRRGSVFGASNPPSTSPVFGVPNPPSTSPVFGVPNPPSTSPVFGVPNPPSTSPVFGVPNPPSTSPVFGVPNPPSTSPVFGVPNPTANPSQEIRKSAKRSKPAKPTPPSDPSDNLFIPREQVRNGPSVRPHDPSDDLFIPREQVRGPSVRAHDPSDDLFIPREQVRGPSNRLHDPSDDLFIPGEQVRGPSVRAHDPSDDLFIPREQVRGPSTRPQHMQARMPRGSQMENGEILPPPPPLPSRWPPEEILPPPPPLPSRRPPEEILPPPPPLPSRRPPYRLSQFRGRARGRSSQFRPRFHQHHSSEFRHPQHLDEPYSPFEPALFPPVHRRGLSRRDRPFRGFRPRGNQGWRPAFGDRRPPVFENSSPPGYNDDFSPPAFGGWLPAD